MEAKQAKHRALIAKFLSTLSRNHLDQGFIKNFSASVERKRSLCRQDSGGRYGSLNRQASRPITPAVSLSITKKKSMNTLTVFQAKRIGDSIRLKQPSVQMKITKPKQLLQSSMRRNRNTLTRFRTTLGDKNAIVLEQLLGMRQNLIHSNQLKHILSELVGSGNASSLRIYKQNLKKYYNLRFVHQKLTSFLDYQYIEDYESQKGVLQTLLSLTLNEIYMLCFITFDLNGDGLICNDDLFNLVTSTNQENPLISRDVYRIFQHMAQYQNSGANIDTLNEDDPLKTQNLTLQKYRWLVVRAEKEKEKQKMQLQSGKATSRLQLKTDLSNANRKGVILSRKVNRHLFSMRAEEEEGKQAIKELRKKYAGYTLESKSNYQFKINFNRFQTIFHNILPELYLDILYLQGGIRLHDRNYAALNFNVEGGSSREKVREEVDRYGLFKTQLMGMRETFREGRIQSFNMQSRRTGKSS